MCAQYPANKANGLVLYLFPHIQASDNGTEPLNSTSMAEIKLLDFNDNVPVFERLVYNASIAENSLPGTKVNILKSLDTSSAALNINQDDIREL